MKPGNVLLHLCSPSEWRTALAAGEVAPPSLADAGFVHLSTPDQVALPAQRLFAGRRDLVLLAVDPDRLDRAGVPVRWEPGVPGDPESMRFPHAYGAVPVSAVLAVLPYRPDGDGRFAAPDVPVLDAAGRARLHQASVLRRTATDEVPVQGGIAVLTGALPASWQHNQLLVDGVVDAATVVAEADRVLGGAGLTHRAALLGGDARPDAGELRAHGWLPEELVTMVAPVDDLAGPVAENEAGENETAGEVGPDELRPLLEAGWRARVPAVSDEQLDQLTGRYRLEDAVVDVRMVGAREQGRIVAGCVLYRDGGTAWLDGLETLPRARRRGHAGHVVRAAARIAAAGGCDLLALDAAAHDWPLRWYTGLGLRESGTTLAAARA